MKIREEFAGFLESLKHAGSGFVDWACWHFNDIIITLLLCALIGVMTAGLVMPR